VPPSKVSITDSFDTLPSACQWRRVLTITSDLDSDPSVAAFLAAYILLTGAQAPLACVVNSTLPTGAGLGSSAAFAVALSAGMLHARRVISSESKTSLSKNFKASSNRCAHLIENFFHGSASGLDNTASTYGGVLVYRKGSEPSFLQMPPMEMVKIILSFFVFFFIITLTFLLYYIYIYISQCV